MEAAQKAKARLLRKGEWTAFEGARQRTYFFGPPTPSAEERLGGVDYFSEDVTVADLRSVFYPDPADVAWISEHIAGRSKEGRRDSSSSFWRSRATHCFTMH